MFTTWLAFIFMTAAVFQEPCNYACDKIVYLLGNYGKLFVGLYGLTGKVCA